MKYKDIAAKYGVTVSAVKSWKSRYWKDKKLQPKKKKVATKKMQRRLLKKLQMKLSWMKNASFFVYIILNIIIK